MNKQNPCIVAFSPKGGQVTGGEKGTDRRICAGGRRQRLSLGRQGRFTGAWIEPVAEIGIGGGVTHEWSGTVSYTPDEYPIVGLMDGHRQYIIGGMAGSGTGVSFNAARCVVNRILGFTDEPDDYPPEYFAPTRLLDPQHHTWPKC